MTRRAWPNCNRACNGEHGKYDPCSASNPDAPWPTCPQGGEPLVRTESDGYVCQMGHGR